MLTRSIRFATDDDLSILREIEIDADALLETAFPGATWLSRSQGTACVPAPGTILVVSASPESPALGFAHMLSVDSEAHLEQLSVRRAAARQGHGRALVHAIQHEARLQGHTSMTLRTFAGVPWNAPFYESCGFFESEPDTEFLRGLVHIEERLGLLRSGKRIQMRSDLTPLTARRAR